MGDRFIAEAIDNAYFCSDHYCNGHTWWYIKDTKTGRKIPRVSEPAKDRIEEMNFIAECIGDINF